MSILEGEYKKFAKFEDFKDLYKDMLETSRKENRDKVDNMRLIRLESMVDSAFNKYDEKEKIEAIRYLVDYDLVPKTWLILQETFHGGFKSITNTTGSNDYRSFK